MAFKTIIIALCFLHGRSFAQEIPLSEPKPAFIALIVSDIDSSISWYSNNLGMSLRNRVDDKEKGFKQANMIRTYLQVELIQVDSSIASQKIQQTYFPGKRIEGYMKFGFKVTDFDKWHYYLQQRKVVMAGKIVTDNYTGKRTFLIRDPDQNLIQLFED